MLVNNVWTAPYTRQTSTYKHHLGNILGL
uniref:Uncharacterized protein n=1 Tax=Arundo donax TaxID=35708 RepID=A0A0A8ZSS9_ARUDO